MRCVSTAGLGAGGGGDCVCEAAEGAAPLAVGVDGTVTDREGLLGPGLAARWPGELNNEARELGWRAGLPGVVGLVFVISTPEIDASENDGGRVAVGVAVEAADAAAIILGESALGNDKLPRLFAPGLASAVARACAAALSLSETATAASLAVLAAAAAAACEAATVADWSETERFGAFGDGSGEPELVCAFALPAGAARGEPTAEVEASCAMASLDGEGDTGREDARLEAGDEAAEEGPEREDSAELGRDTVN